MKGLKTTIFLISINGVNVTFTSFQFSFKKTTQSKREHIEKKTTQSKREHIKKKKTQSKREHIEGFQELLYEML